MAADRNGKMNAQILEEAADWLVDFNSGSTVDAAAREKFDAWLRASPEHVRAYLELVSVWEDGEALPYGEDVSATTLISMAQASDPNVVALRPELASTPPMSGSSAARLPRGWRRFAAVAAITAVISVVAITSVWLSDDSHIFSTGVGEQRSISLEDGSTVVLNAHSRLRIDFTPARRDVRLVEGQALFRVAHDAQRPFIVTSDSTQVRAVGTEFDVNRRRGGTVVTVVEGAVDVSGGAASPQAPPSERLTGGHRVVVRDFEISNAEKADVRGVTAWTQRRLVFNASTLGEVAEEFNRFNQQRIVLRDEAAAGFPITATFSSTSTEPLVRFLKIQPGIRTVVSADQIEIASVAP
ncbi:MAG: FecR domain-containing protein [Gammaproteobacteria bacterium]